MGATGVKVTDKGKVHHQDHAVAVLGVVAQLAGPVASLGIMALGLSPVPLRRSLSIGGSTPDDAGDYEDEWRPWAARGERPWFPTSD